jgi:hypothetical protein
MKVYHAINQVQRALASEGISKSRKNQQQGYNFRGIDDVYNTVSPLLGQHGLCILPRVLSRECIERQNKSGGALFYVTCEVEFDFVSAEDGSKHVVKTYGEAMDSADKATNKAMSAAYKYALMQAFAIPTEGDNDADAHHHDVEPQRKANGLLPGVGVHKGTDGMLEALPDEMQMHIRLLASVLPKMFEKEGVEAVFDKIEAQQFENDERVALWGLLTDSKLRSALKREGEKRHIAAKNPALAAGDPGFSERFQEQPRMPA